MPGNIELDVCHSKQKFCLAQWKFPDVYMPAFVHKCVNVWIRIDLCIVYYGLNKLLRNDWIVM